MLSITQRIGTAPQPRKGYLPIKQFTKNLYHDEEVIRDPGEESYSFSAIQGMVVDYLTRMKCGLAPLAAFKVSLMGAAAAGETDSALNLINRIHGTDDESIVAACNLVQYDYAIRHAPVYFRSESKEPNEAIRHNIRVMVSRGEQFLKSQGGVISAGFTLEGGYTQLVSSGDGDFLTPHGLWDFKTSSRLPTSYDTLQVLMYYIMGLRSKKKEFQKIESIGFFNPLFNVSFSIKVTDIPDRVFKKVSHDVIGYNVPKDEKLWREAYGEDPEVIQDFFRFYYPKDTLTKFDPSLYSDGIFDISKDDYWTFLHDKAESQRPRLPYTESIKLIKHDNYFMFVSISPKGRASIMQGGRLRHLKKPLQYYYDNIPAYANSILTSLSKYWDTLYEISRFIRSIDPNEAMIQKQLYKEECAFRKKEGLTKIKFETFLSEQRNWHDEVEHARFSGRVHGCIVDLDLFNHIYLNPFDGKITGYYAETMYSKHVYKNVASLVAAQRPEMLSGFTKNIEQGSSSILALANSASIQKELILNNHDIDTYYDIVYSTDIYNVSNKLKPLQMVYDYKLVQVWYDDILFQNKTDRKQLTKKLIK